MQEKKESTIKRRFSIYALIVIMYVFLIWRKIDDLYYMKVVVGSIAILLFTHITIANEMKDRNLKKDK